jgi:pyrroline-5-carboxylate reductase
MIGGFSWPQIAANENEINDITILSGSGPAYFFYLTQLVGE